MCFKSAPFKYSDPRQFGINFTEDNPDPLEFPSNFIKTSKYNIVTFLPFSLLGQFTRYANIYFLFTAIIQSISILSPLNPFSAIAPLVFVLGLSMLREGIKMFNQGFEDWGRHKSDAEVNAMDTTILQNGREIKTSWADVHVGDLVIVRQDEMFATDIIVLGSVYETGVCYIETSSLDGEKNLKPKSAIKETQSLFSSQNYVQGKFSIFANPPNSSLGDFEGAITLPSGSKKILNGKNLLLRGAFLRNTKWIIGVVAYTGEDTKIMRNAEPGRIKQSSIERQMNKLILAILCVQILACTLSAVLASWWMHSEGYHHVYFWQHSDNPNVFALIAFFSYFLLYNTMIPISLIVSLEFVKVFQCYFIEKDEDMYVAQRDKFAKAQTSTINEELGQVEYIFSDKTGTLTCNQMEFKYCIIGSTLYGFDPKDRTPKVVKAVEHPNPKQHQHSIFTFEDTNLTGIIKNDPKYLLLANTKLQYKIPSRDKSTHITFATQKDIIHEYLFLLASAHECLAQHENNTTVYQGPSPDEITLVDAAMNLGFKFEGQSSSSQEFTILGKKKNIECLYQFEFDSDRKRMSVVVRDNGQYKLYIKGADSIIKSRLATDQPQEQLDYANNKLSEFSTIGLRTLLMAMRVLSDAEFNEFDKKMQQLADAENREDDKAKIADALERDLYLLGATAVEDKLQPEVPETIADLLKANIKVWMLTGDKLETAENIAKSCKLIQGDFTIMRFAETDEMQLRQKIMDNKETYYLCIKEKRKKSFLVEGPTLTLILENPQLKREFVKMAQNCESVVCCRVTPKQKAAVVKLIKDSLNKITLAIGDGANDVNMIQEAHIGIGLYGNEGMRAVQSSDFALGEFRCLWKLLLVHGHWSYVRISEMILYFFYKNMIFTVPQFLYSFYSGYSAQTFFDDWYITFFNLFFTSMPLIVRATFDRSVYFKITHKNTSGEALKLYDKSEKYLKGKFPGLYYIGQKGTVFTVPNFIYWWGQGFIHGLLVFFLTLACLDIEMVQDNGQTAGFAPLSITAYTAIIFIVDIKIALYTKFWTWINVISLVILSIGIYIAYYFISNWFPGSYSEYTPVQLLQSPTFYLIIAFLNGAIFIFDICINAVLHEYYATESDRILEWRENFKDLIQHDDVIPRIELMQMNKRETGQRKWGDTFYELILEERLTLERERQEVDAKDLKGSERINVTSPAEIQILVNEHSKPEHLRRPPQPFEISN